MRWVVPGRIAAGPYPRDLPSLRSAGVDTFVDLTEPGELLPYAIDGVEYRRMPIRDFGIPSVAKMEAIVELLDELLGRGRTVYLHCSGGTGRTGTVLGCYLVRHGQTADEALAAIDGPETDEQRAFVRAWR